MPAEVKLRQRESTRADPTANIPTTIKNPERVAHRRTELIEVATKLFLERGFHNTSIRDIVRACSFNIASLYMYVSSKEDILYLVALDLMNSIARELGETKLDANSARQSLADGFASYCRICDRLRRPIRLLYREVGFLPDEPRSNVLHTVADVVSFFERIVRKGIESGEFRNLNPRMAALDILMLCHTIALHTREVRELTNLNQYIDYQLNMLLAGLMAERVAKKKTAAKHAAGRAEPAQTPR
jgi:AcrR family transcriptional regulator